MSRIVLIIAATLVLRAAPLALAQDPITPVELEQRITRAFDRRAYEEAVPLIEAYLDGAPRDVTMLYNLACAFARLERRDEAASTLLRAVEAGFLDFGFMEIDPDLASLRGHPLYEKILEAARQVDTMRSDEVLDRWRQTYGDGEYLYEVDDARKLAYAVALDEATLAEVREMLARQADEMIATFFAAPPSFYVLIAVPTVEHAARLFPEDRMGGVYQPGMRRLIARDIGNALRHEFFHAYHFGHMGRTGQVHSIAIQEGLASLYEDYEFRDGEIVFLPNDRHNVVKNRARVGRLRPWRKLFNVSSQEFMDNPGSYYPEVRSAFEFIADQGQLGPWYEAYLESFDEDPSGIAALEAVFGQTTVDIEKAYRAWLDDRPMFDNTIEQGDAYLGIVSSIRSSNDGVVVEEIVPGSTAQRARFRPGDVIVAVEGRATRTFSELLAEIGKYEVGDRVTIRVRRGSRYRDQSVTLQPR